MYTYDLSICLSTACITTIESLDSQYECISKANPRPLIEMHTYESSIIGAYISAPCSSTGSRTILVDKYDMKAIVFLGTVCTC